VKALEDYMSAHEKVGDSVEIRAKIALIHDRFGINSFNKGKVVPPVSSLNTGIVKEPQLHRALCGCD
jgi:hypothetical protein